jgi:hypothetical protein
VEGLGGATDGSTPDRRFFADTRAYWGNLAQLRTDKASLKAEVAELKKEVVTVEGEREGAVDKAYNAAVARDKSLAQLSQLRPDVAREKAIKEAQERAVAEAAAAAKAKAEEQRRREVAADIASRARTEKEKADRKTREEAKEAEKETKAERLRQHLETEEERKSRELSELMQSYRDSNHDDMRTRGR